MPAVRPRRMRRSMTPPHTRPGYPRNTDQECTGIVDRDLDDADGHSQGHHGSWVPNLVIAHEALLCKPRGTTKTSSAGQQDPIVPKKALHRGTREGVRHGLASGHGTHPLQGGQSMRAASMRGTDLLRTGAGEARWALDAAWGMSPLRLDFEIPEDAGMGTWRPISCEETRPSTGTTPSSAIADGAACVRVHCAMHVSGDAARRGTPHEIEYGRTGNDGRTHSVTMEVHRTFHHQ